ncbi:MAG: nucleotidyl transferase AbiEii/AbiGii toxin family protein [Thiohalophilus sp.]|uniref:nucleotidyl transferase AbiEii/AbiGii toxin family protein n=1 Tax=Thiohalophilus sp. TaxID=3028392 RepID=UPI002870A414|nr:nucleotidyl transferase AbiEii/AbiGii toxin family protein [Thiohalophilus sp.]MDR9437640.1 nucleotidyl transferase AbiEii/AbiGii toxin family protein [Thiohalophilus sp.]
MIELIQKRLEAYSPGSPLEEENALKEIVQEILLFALWREGFFEVAAFQGGTSLRILHGLPRFSEDIDFILQSPDPAFTWKPYLENLAETCKEFGIEPEVLDRDQMDQHVKAALIKDNSIANQLNLDFVNHRDQKLKIKLEIDCNPPAGSGFDYTYLDFPVDYEVCNQDLSSNFALKIHALLCRAYIKGRDWYDFNWYIAQGVTPNLALLKNALFQFGPYQGQELNVDREWLANALRQKIASINWQDAAGDVERFLKPVEQKSLNLWSERFYESKLKALESILM